jgi:hypothetical protein
VVRKSENRISAIGRRPHIAGADRGAADHVLADVAQPLRFHNPAREQGAVHDALDVDVEVVVVDVIQARVAGVRRLDHAGDVEQVVEPTEPRLHLGQDLPPAVAVADVVVAQQEAVAGLEGTRQSFFVDVGQDQPVAALRHLASEVAANPAGGPGDHRDLVTHESRPLKCGLLGSEYRMGVGVRSSRRWSRPRPRFGSRPRPLPRTQPLPLNILVIK